MYLLIKIGDRNPIDYKYSYHWHQHSNQEISVLCQFISYQRQHSLYKLLNQIQDF